MSPKSEQDPAEIKSGHNISNADIIPDAGKVHLGKSAMSKGRQAELGAITVATDC